MQHVAAMAPSLLEDVPGGGGFGGGGGRGGGSGFASGADGCPITVDFLGLFCLRALLFEGGGGGAKGGAGGRVQSGVGRLLVTGLGGKLLWVLGNYAVRWWNRRATQQLSRRHQQDERKREQVGGLVLLAALAVRWHLLTSADRLRASRRTGSSATS
jgi:hypothetical protein